MTIHEPVAYRIDDQLADFAELPKSVEQRRRLCARDGAGVDQIQSGIRKLWVAAGLQPDEMSFAPEGATRSQAAAIASLLTLRAAEERGRVLHDAGEISDATALACGHILQELRMALAGFMGLV